MNTRHKVLTLGLLIAALVVLRQSSAKASCTQAQFQADCNAAQQACDSACDGGEPGCSYCMNFSCQYDPETNCYTGETDSGCSPWTCDGGGDCYGEGESCGGDQDCCMDLHCVGDECVPVS